MKFVKRNEHFKRLTPRSRPARDQEGLLRSHLQSPARHCNHSYAYCSLFEYDMSSVYLHILWYVNGSYVKSEEALLFLLPATGLVRSTSSLFMMFILTSLVQIQDDATRAVQRQVTLETAQTMQTTRRLSCSLGSGR